MIDYTDTNDCDEGDIVASRKERAAERYDTALTAFVAHVQSIQPDRPHMAEVSVMSGRKYDRIVVEGSAHCFVRKSDGAVLKSASWKAPAKHVRGTIYGPAGGYGVDWTGANYLR